MNRAHLEVDGLDRTEGALDVGQRLVVAHTIRRFHLRDWHRGANNVEAIQGSFSGDAVRLASERERPLVDDEFKVFGDLVLVDDLADAHADHIHSREFAGGHLGLDRPEVLLCGGQQGFALVRAQLGQLRIATGHQAFAGIVR